LEEELEELPVEKEKEEEEDKEEGCRAEAIAFARLRWTLVVKCTRS